MNPIDKPDQEECSCSHCTDSGIIYLYNKDGDVVSMPCPVCTDE